MVAKQAFDKAGAAAGVSGVAGVAKAAPPLLRANPFTSFLLAAVR